MIKINNLNKFYNKGKSNQIHVINDTSLELPSKGLITFLGHSGSGKTTLLNVIGGLDKFNNGNITYDDKEFNKYSMSKIDKFRSRNIGYVFQNYNLLLEETVYDNLRIALDLIGVTDLEEQKKRIEYSLKAVGMFKYRKKVASFLSGGQQQRVSIARALVKKSMVIIADEPTGNLDSKNTMEVMNILKKISEQSLVLLVTHETDVANFYSDIIYEIKDGSIVGNKEVNSDATFNSNSDESTVYLKDLNESKLTTDLGDVEIHSDTEEPLKINLDIIVKNGNIYLKADKPIKLLEQSNINVVDDHYKELKREDITDFDYDTSWYNDTKDDSNKLKKFGKRIANSFISFKAVGKKQKFLYLCLFFIGAIMSLSFSFLSFATTVDDSSYSYSKNIKTVVRTADNRQKSLTTIFNDAYIAGEVTDVYEAKTAQLVYSETIVYSHSYNQSFIASIVPYINNNAELSLGNAPMGNEMVVSTDIASSIASKTGRSIEEVVGLPITIGDSYSDPIDITISGVSKNDNKMAYLSSDAYENYRLNDSNYYYRNDSYVINNEIYTSSYDLRYKPYEKYDIISGRDVDLDSENFEVVASNDSKHKVGDTITIYSYTSEENITLNVVGLYDNFVYANYYRSPLVMNKDVDFAKCFIEPMFIFDGSSNVSLIEGRYPTGLNEVALTPYYSADAKLGEKIYISELGEELTVVGFYNSKKYNNNVLIPLSSYSNYTDYYDAGKFSFTILNEALLNERLAKNDLKIISMDEAVLTSAVAEKQEAVKEFIIIFAVTTIAAAIFVYFIMRSKMMADIYNIGVYRSLGSSRMRINNKYFADIFILTTFTCFLGYVLSTLFYYFISYTVNSIFVEIGLGKVMLANLGITSLGVLVLYLIMNIFGMLPILMLERKTPSEIIAKYDI